MSTATIETTSPGCPEGDQGFHIYAPTAGEEPTECLECGIQRSPLQILAELVEHEPPRGSVILEKGPQGTAWQRHYSTGSWKSTTGRSAVWSGILSRSTVGSRTWLIYVPPASL